MLPSRDFFIFLMKSRFDKNFPCVMKFFFVCQFEVKSESDRREKIKMRNFLLLIFIVKFVNSQPNDQAIMAEFHPVFTTTVLINSAIVVDDFNPLRIETSGNGFNLRVIEVTIPDERSNPVVMEVFHPGIVQKFPRVVWINFQRVQMRRIGENSFRTCGNMRAVFFDYNLIEEIPVGTFKNCPNLNWLKLRFNRIKKINPESFEGLLNMKDLELEGNQISSIAAEDFKFLPSLRTLWISRNPLKVISAQSFPNSLLGLDLIDCQISELQPDTFSNLPQLTYLNLGQNPITDLPPGALSFNLFLSPDCQT